MDIETHTSSSVICIVIDCDDRLLAEYSCVHVDHSSASFCTVIMLLFLCIVFQVITGGNYDVDLEIMSPGKPGKRVLYKEIKKQYDSFTWTTDPEGEYQFCFSNEFSTFTHKLVYFDFQVICHNQFCSVWWQKRSVSSIGDK